MSAKLTVVCVVVVVVVVAADPQLQAVTAGHGRHRRGRGQGLQVPGGYALCTQVSNAFLEDIIIYNLYTVRNVFLEGVILCYTSYKECIACFPDHIISVT